MVNRVLPKGLYDLLLTMGMEEELARLGEAYEIESAGVDDEEAHGTIGQFVEKLATAALSAHRGGDGAEERIRLATRIVAAVGRERDEFSAHAALRAPLTKLLAIRERGAPARRPDLPLARGDVLTGTRQDPSLASQLAKEIQSADAIDMLVSFIRWSGLVLLLEALRELTSTPSALGRPRLRVITTSYMGATDPRAVEELASLPNTEVRVSYDTTRTRLHAKAYIVHRATGFGSAYVGSANVSQAALTEGLEWTNKVSQYEQPHLWNKLSSTFDVYWRLYDFVPFRSEDCPGALESLICVLQARFARLDHATHQWDPERGGPLALHATYTRDEVLAGLGYWDLKRRPACREGTREIPQHKLDVFFVTLQKTESEYSPTTMYEDYAIDATTFHWQSQSTTSATSPTGRRYIEHLARGYVPLLFVRERRYANSGLSMPFTFLGPLRYRSHSGSSPISFTWDLEHPMPARVLRLALRLVAA